MRIVWAGLLALLLVFGPGVLAQAPCDPNRVTDPLGLANGSSVSFVDPHNCNCSDTFDRPQTMNPSTPWCGLAGVTENHGIQLAPGDTVYFRGGDYNGREAGIVSSGTPSARITLKPYPGETVVWRGGSTSFERLFSATSNYLTLEGFTLIGHVDTSQGPLYMPVLLSFSDTTGLELRNLTLEPFQSVNDIGYGNRWPAGSGKEGWGHAIKLYNADNFKIQNVKITCQNAGENYPALQFNGDGLQLDSSRNGVVENSEFKDCGHIPLTVRFNSTNVTLQNNVISNVFHTGLASGVGSNHNIIRNNVIKNYNSKPNDLSNRSHGIELLGESDSLIYNNIVYNGADNGNGISLANSQDPNFFQNNNNKIFHNTVYSTNYNNLSLASNGLFGSNNWTNNNQIKNNIFYGIQQYQSEGEFLHGEIRVYGYDYEGNNGYNNVFETNLVQDFRAGEKPIVSRNFKNNTYYRYTVAEFNDFSWASGNLEGNPLFVNPSGGDFRLQAASPAVNAAPCLSEVSTDFFGATRSNGGGCTIGAIEFDPLVQSVCGNGTIESGEQCDGFNLNSQSCASLGFGTGALSCSSLCQFVTSSCSNPPPDDGSDSCVPDWRCDPWGACINDIQLRMCRDLQNCGLIANRPPVSQACGADVPQSVDANENSIVSAPACSENWRCGEWGACVEGLERRTCTDVANCGSFNQQPEILRACGSTGVQAAGVPSLPEVPVVALSALALGLLSLGAYGVIRSRHA